MELHFRFQIAHHGQHVDIPDVDFVNSVVCWSQSWHNAYDFQAYSLRNNLLIFNDFIMNESWQKISETNPNATITFCSYIRYFRRRIRITPSAIKYYFRFHRFVYRFIHNITLWQTPKRTCQRYQQYVFSPRHASHYTHTINHSTYTVLVKLLPTLFLFPLLLFLSIIFKLVQKP